MTESGPHKWAFKARLRRHAFGWRSQPAIERVREAVAEIKKVARKDPVVAAEGAVAFLERISPALEHVDSSSGAIGTAVNNAIAELVPVIVNAPADPKIRAGWLERLFEAHAEDQIPYIEIPRRSLGRAVCVEGRRLANGPTGSSGITRMALSPDKNLRGHFHGTTACLSALYVAERYDDLLDLLETRELLALQALGGESARRAGEEGRGHPATPRPAAAHGRVTGTSTGSARRCCCPPGWSTRRTPATV